MDKIKFLQIIEKMFNVVTLQDNNLYSYYGVKLTAGGIERWWNMILLTKRQEAMLYFLIGGKESITTKKLASKYQLSERMIHYDLEYISRWLKEREHELVKNKSGYFIQLEEEQKHRLLKELFLDDIQHRILTKADRYLYIYERLLLGGGAVSSDEIVADLQVSKPTILNDLKEVEKVAARYNLSLNSKKGAGYWLEGREIDIRRQLIQTITRTLIQNHIQNYEQLNLVLKMDERRSVGHYYLTLNYIKEINIGPICEIMNDIRADRSISISDIDCFNLFIAVVVLVRRLSDEKTLKKENILQIKKGEEVSSYRLGRKICSRLEEEYEIYCSKVEIDYLVLTLISTNASVDEGRQDESLPHLEHTVERMLATLQEYPAVRIERRFMDELKAEVKEYLALLLRKRKLHIQSQNSLLAQTKAEYTELFGEVSKMAEIFREEEGMTLTQEEIGGITVCIAAYSEHFSNRGEKTAVIVCDENKSIARLLKNRIKNNIANLKIVDFVSVYEFRQDRTVLDSVDFVISTIQLENVALPVFQINPIISAVDIRNINDFTTGRKSIQVLVDTKEKENYLKDALISALTKYVGADELNNLKDELDYFLSAGSNLISLENSKVIEEEYAYAVSMLLVKLCEMFKRINHATGKVIEMDIMIGLVIHITMTAARWKQKEFYHEKAMTEYTGEAQKIYRNVEIFLEDAAKVFHHKIEICEAAAIMRYLI